MILAVVTFVAALTAMAVAVAAFQRRPDPLALPLVALMVASAAWAGPHAIGKLGDDLSWVLLWTYAQYPGTVAAPLCYLVVAASYAGFRRHLTRRRLALLSVLPVVSVGMVWTNGFHGLVWRSTEVDTAYGASILVAENGPYFYLHLGYLYLLTLGGLVILGHAAVTRGRAYRKEATIMLLAGLIPLAVNVMVTTGTVLDPNIDLTPAALAVSGALFALALFRFDLINVSELARQDLVDHLEDGVIIVDHDDRVQEFNRTAATIVDELAVDMPLDRFLDPAVISDGGLVTLDTELGATRYFQPRVAPIEGDRGNRLGRVVYLTDVTDLVQREQRLSVLNRILRHNIRNELTVTMGNLELLEDDLDDADQTTQLAAARAGIDQVLDFSEKARLLEDRLDDQRHADRVDLVELLDRALADCRERFPEATFDADESIGGTPVTVRSIDGKLLEVSIREVLENGVEHNDASSPAVTVELVDDDESVTLTVSDNGPGIPDIEREVLGSPQESALHHGSGLGLWFVEWTVSMSDGSLAFGDDRDGGEVVISLQRAD